MTRQRVLEDARARMKRRRKDSKWIGGLVSTQAYEAMRYAQQEWGLTSNMEVLDLALQFLAMATRDGLMHPGVPGYEMLAAR